MSDPARPESDGQAALAELASVIRHVTEQLAGFRRRALAAESRVRELEQAAVSVEQSVRTQASRVAALEASLDASLGEVQRQGTQLAQLRSALDEANRQAARIEELERALGDAERASDAARRSSVEVVGASVEPSELLRAENVALRERLGEAAERTRVIGERVRFLRQQLGNGGEK